MQTQPVSQLLLEEVQLPPLESNRKCLVAPHEKSMRLNAEPSLCYCHLQLVTFEHPKASWKPELALEGSNSTIMLFEAKSLGSSDQKASVKASTQICEWSNYWPDLNTLNSGTTFLPQSEKACVCQHTSLFFSLRELQEPLLPLCILQVTSAFTGFHSTVYKKWYKTDGFNYKFPKASAGSI